MGWWQGIIGWRLQQESICCVDRTFESVYGLRSTVLGISVYIYRVDGFTGGLVVVGEENALGVYATEVHLWVT